MVKDYMKLISGVYWGNDYFESDNLSKGLQYLIKGTIATDKRIKSQFLCDSVRSYYSEQCIIKDTKFVELVLGMEMMMSSKYEQLNEAIFSVHYKEESKSII